MVKIQLNIEVSNNLIFVQNRILLRKMPLLFLVFRDFWACLQCFSRFQVIVLFIQYSSTDKPITYKTFYNFDKRQKYKMRCQ